MQHHRLYSVITKHDWLTNEPIEAMVVATARLDSTLDEIRSRVPRSTGYLAVVSGLTLSEAGRVEKGRNTGLHQTYVPNAKRPF